MATVLGSSRNDFRWCQNLNEKSDYSWPCRLLAAHPALLWEPRVQEWAQGSCPAAADTPSSTGVMGPRTATGWRADPTRRLKARQGAKINGRVWQSMHVVGHTGLCMSKRRTQKSLKIQSRLLSSPLLPFLLISVSYSFTLMNALFLYTEGM